MKDINDIKSIKIEDYDYPLPDERIAKHPLKQRDACKLLLSRPDGAICHTSFSQVAGLLPFSSMMVCNNTRVINARLHFTKSTGATIEIFLLEPHQPSDYQLAFQAEKVCQWCCMIGNLKRWKDGLLYKNLEIGGKNITLSAQRLQGMPGNAHIVEFCWDNPAYTWADIVEAAGKIPIPPYLQRDTEASDSVDYQTVYSRIKGSVAAPTAGLHFTDSLLEDIKAHNIEILPLSLHVGAGTFQPVKSDQIGEHPMHTETFSISRSLLKRLISAKESGEKVTAVGTTSVRTLESLPLLGANLLKGDETLHITQWEAYSKEYEDVDTLKALQAIMDKMDSLHTDSLTATTAIMIAPGFRWRIVDVMITNFHQPQSTLLLLVSSFLGNDESGNPRWQKIYHEALENDYRFLSYGDACLFFRQ